MSSQIVPSQRTSVPNLVERTEPEHVPSQRTSNPNISQRAEPEPVPSQRTSNLNPVETTETGRVPSQRNSNSNIIQRAEPRPRLAQGTSDLKVLENGEQEYVQSHRTSDQTVLERGEPRPASQHIVDHDPKKRAKKERDMKKVDRLNSDLNLILVIVGLLSAVITTFMVYIQPQLIPDSGEETAALLRILVYNVNNSAFPSPPEVPKGTPPQRYLLASEYILYIALLTALTGGVYALIIRLASALYSWKIFLYIFEYFSRFVVWITIFFLLCAFCLLGLAVTLQLLVITPIGFSAIKKATVG